jgi:hypothetical protein
MEDLIMIGAALLAGGAVFAMMVRRSRGECLP